MGSRYQQNPDDNLTKINFQMSKMTPNDRVFLQSARNNIFSSMITAGGGTFLVMYATLRFKRPKSFYKAWSLLGATITSSIAGLYTVREEYQRGIIELPDDSYFRRFLFNAAVNYNPELNAQQLYSKLSLEYDDHRKNVESKFPPNKPN